MDQVKEILRQMIKYRFWIAVGISALLPVIAYAVGSGPIKKKAEDETKKITDAQKNAQQYASGVLPNAQYKPIVEVKKTDLSRSVNASWQKLYDRQAPLLTWPQTVEDRFRAWGRKWPENVDPSNVRLAVVDYVTAYPRYVTEVYQIFRPYDPMEGTGVVAAPSEAALLRPAPFKIESPPELGKVWAAQERLWIQRTLLQVVADVNRDAKAWDSAIIKQINKLEVGNSAAQDQVSIGKGEALEEAPAIDAPGAAAAPAAPAEGTGMPGMPGMMGMGGAQEAADSVFYIKSPSPEQFKILPVHMSVLIDQDRIPDFLVALENSPMAIQVVDFEMAKPGTKVTKPEKGANFDFGGGMMAGMYGMGGMPTGGARMAMYGMPDMSMMMRGQMMNPSMMMQGGYGGGMPAAPTRKGVDKRAENREAKRTEELAKAKKSIAHTIQDPYFFIVEVSIYGQARFYNPPPPAPASEASQAGTAAAPADGQAPQAGTEPGKAAAPANAQTPPAATEPAKDETTKTPTEAAKPEAAGKEEGAANKAEGEPKKSAEPAKDEPAKKTEAESKKDEGEPKKSAEPAKDEPAKSDSGSAAAKK